MATLTPGASAASGRPALPRARPYKDFLTPALHRSFTNAALSTLVVCWLEACLMSKFSLFWSWFPLGLNGIRTSLLFIACLTVFLLRLTNLHLGRSIYTTAFEGFWRTVLTRQAVFAVFWYYISALLFSEIYIFSTSEVTKLEWVDTGRTYERARLNENAVIFRTLFVMLALCQAAVHLYLDYDALQLPYSTRSADGKSLSLAPSPAQLPPLRQLQQFAIPLFVLVATITTGVAVVGPIVYFTLLRTLAWDLSFSVASSIYNLSPSGRPGLYDAWALFARFFWSAGLLVTLWQVTNLAFTIMALTSP